MVSSVEELLVTLIDCAWDDAPKNIRQYGQDIVMKGLQILLEQFKLPYALRDHELIRINWKIVNEEGRKTGLFNGLDVPSDCKDEFRRFLRNEFH